MRFSVSRWRLHGQSAQSQGIPLYEVHERGSQRISCRTDDERAQRGVMHSGREQISREYMIVPFGAPDFHTALQWGAETYHALQDILKREPTRPHRRRGRVRPQRSHPMRSHSNSSPRLSSRRGPGPAGISGSRSTRDRAGSVMTGSTNSNAKEGPAARRIDRGITRKLVATVLIVSIEDGLAEDEFNGWRS